MSLWNTNQTPYRFKHQLSYFGKLFRQWDVSNAKFKHPLDISWANATQLRSSDSIGAELFQAQYLPQFLAAIANDGANVIYNLVARQDIRRDTNGDLSQVEQNMIDNPNMLNGYEYLDDLGSEIQEESVEGGIQGYWNLFATHWSTDTVKGIGAEHFSDELFANQSVAGALPTVIKRFSVDDFDYYSDQGFGLTNDIFLDDSPFTQNDDNDLLTIAQEGRLYIQDFSRLDNIKGSDTGANSSEKRYIFAPFALYAVTDDDNPRLLPIAIQMRQTDRDINGEEAWDPIFVPHMRNAVTYDTYMNPTDDGDPDSSPEFSWEFAKLAVSSAANLYHEFGEHLALTHLMLENISLSLIRIMHKNHPIHAILRPHLKGTRAINAFARTTLINKGGYIDRYMSATVDDFNSNAAKELHDRDFVSKSPLNLLNDHDIDDLPYYPYRDDVRLVWSAVKGYVQEILDLFYDDGSQFSQDRNNELGAFIHDITNDQTIFGGATIKGLNFGNVDTYEDLVEFVTYIIFTASAQHAAVNYPQGDYFSNVALCPATVSRPTPIPGQTTREQYHEFLPPRLQALPQMNLMRVLTSFRYTRLGIFKGSDFYDARVWPIITRFQNALDSIENEITDRNNQLPSELEYIYLLPSNIPQSTNL